MRKLTSVHLKIFLCTSKVAVAKLHVVFFVRNLAQKIDAVQLMEDLQANSVSFDSSLGIRSSQVGLWHSNDLEIFICDDLISN